jgi:hypothetical protein
MLAQAEIHALPGGIHGTVKLMPDAIDADIGLVHMPVAMGGLEVPAEAVVKLWGLGLDPAVDGARIDLDPSLGHDLLEVAVAQRVGQIPADAEQDHRTEKVAAFEGGRVAHLLSLEMVLEAGGNLCNSVFPSPPSSSGILFNRASLQMDHGLGQSN